MMRVLPFLIRLHVRSRLEYRGAMILMWVAQAFAYSSTYGSIWLIVTRFKSIGGWQWPEIALMLSFHLLAYSLGAALSFTQFRDMEDHVRLGTFDTLLIKPMSPWAYLVFSGFNIGYTGHIALALGLMAWSLTNVSLDWNPLFVFYYVGALLSASGLIAAVITMIGANSLIWVRSRHLFSIFFGFWELARYPLNIFPVVIQGLLLTLMPLGFMSFVPVAVLLKKPVPLIGWWGGPLALVAGPIVILIAVSHWRYCIHRYRGAGG